MISHRQRHLLLLLLARHVTSVASAIGAHSTLTSSNPHQRGHGHPSQRHLWSKDASSALHVRGGGAKSSSSYSGALPSHLLSASGERLASAWQKEALPRLQSWKRQLAMKLDEIKGAEDRDGETTTTRESRGPRTSSNHRNQNQSTTTLSATVSSLLVPSRVFKLTLLALLLAEGLDRVGILYEDAPALLKSRLDDFWFYTLQPKLIRWKESAQLFYWHHIEPLLPNAILYSDFYNAPWSTLSYHFLSTTKVAFAVGATIGMVASPLLAQGATKYWKPILVIYGLAEINHFCTKRGQKFVQWLGETPQTLGATLDGILNQVRNLVRRIFLGEKHVDDYGSYHGANNRLGYSGNSRLPLLGGGDDTARNINRSKKSRTQRKSGDDESDFEVLLEDFKEWMVVNAPQRYQQAPSLLPPSRFADTKAQEKRQFATKGFLIGCGLGLAFFRV